MTSITRYSRFGLALALTAAAWAQDFRASISGLVTDPAGAAVPGVKVRATDVSRNATTEVTTNETGRYTIPFLIPGKYNIEVEANGFKRFVRENVELQINDRAALDVALEIGAVSDKITVTQQMTLLETESANRGGIVDNELLLNVPNAGRNVFQLAFAMPGVYKPSTSQSTSFNLDGIANSRASINGAASGLAGTESNTDILIDGTSDTKGDRQVIMIPALESVQEFRVLTNVYDAQYGRTGGGIVTTTTKSGTNRFHGTVFDRYEDYRLGANSWSNNRQGVGRAQRVQHNYGFNATGPIWVPKVFDGRDRLFFMVNYDSSPSSSLYTSQGNVPLPEMKNGDFSRLFAQDGRPVIIYDPATTRLTGTTYTRTPFAGNRIPASMINPVGAKLVNIYPNPTREGDTPARLNNFFQQTPNNGELWQWTGRLDVRLNDRHNFFGRYGETNMTRTGDLRWPVGSPAETSTILPRTRRGRTITIDWTATLNATTTFNMRAGFSRQENVFGNPQTLAFNPAELFPSATVAQFLRRQYPFVNMGVYLPQGSGPQDTADDTYSASPNVGKVIGAHVIKFGAEGRDFRSTVLAFGSASGNFAFGRLWTQADPNRADAFSGNEIATALLGFPTAGSADIAIAPAYRSKYWALFFQDDWKVSRKLTINLGLRWDYEGPIAERYNRQNRGFAFGQPSPLADQVRNRPGSENCPACRAGLTGGVLFAGSSGSQRLAFNPDRNNFQPRIGVAYTLDGKTVLRGGFGLYQLGQWAFGSPAGFSRATPVITTVDGVTPSASISNPFPNGLLTPIGSSLGLATDLGLGLSVNYIQRGLPATKQFSFGIQRDLPGGFLVDVSYVGNHATGLPISGNLNFIPASELGRPASFYNERITNPFAGLLPNNAALNAATVPRSALMTAYPQYTGVTVSSIPAGRNRYDAMQLTVKRRFANGLSFQANYTAAKTLEQLLLLNPQNFNLADLRSPRLEKRLTIFDVPQKASILGTYELPVGKGRPWLNDMNKVLNGLLGNWKLGWNLTYQSGFPVDFPNAAPLAARSAKLPKDQRSLTRWFDTSLFPRVAGPAPFTLRDFPSRFPDVRFMDVRNHDFSLMKDIHILGERLRTQVRADFINAFNRPYFTQNNGNPPNVTSPNFGQLILQQNNQPRVIYLEFRMSF